MLKVAAAEVGYSESHACRLAKKPGIRRLVTRLRDELTKELAGMLTGYGRDAVDSLRELLGKDVPPQVRLGAAKAVLDLSLRYRDAAEVAEMLDKTEGSIKALQYRAVTTLRQLLQHEGFT